MDNDNCDRTSGLAWIDTTAYPFNVQCYILIYQLP